MLSILTWQCKCPTTHTALQHQIVNTTVQAFGTLAVAWTIYRAYRLWKNYPTAAKLQVPLVCVPISLYDPLWIALQTAFTSFFKFVPFNAFAVTRYCRLGWEFHDRFSTHVRLGDVWMLVTPDRSWLYISEAEAAQAVFSRGRDFGRPVWTLSRL